MLPCESSTLHDAWHSAVYRHLCFDQRRWVLRTQRKLTGDVWHSAFRAFERFPLVQAVEPQRSTCGNEEGNLTFIADLRHAGSRPPGIAHFAKRVLRLWGVQRQQPSLAFERIVFPATTSEQLRSDWIQSLLQLVAPHVAIVPAEELVSLPRECFARALASGRSDTYFTRPKDAEALRLRAYQLARVADQRACVPLRACYFRRAEGIVAGRWEGGPRMVANRKELLRLMANVVNTVAPGGAVAQVGVNSSHSFAEQVALFASCDVLVSVHGSHNANLMFMRPGSAFIELNPHKFFYASYQALAEVAGIHYIPSRSNAIATTELRGKEVGKAEAFARKYGTWTDVRCQAVGGCRQQSRSFPTHVNTSDFAAGFARALLAVVAGWPCITKAQRETARIRPKLRGQAQLEHGRPPRLPSRRQLQTREPPSSNREVADRVEIGTLAQRAGESRRDRIAVCIVGQLSRLELSSKIAHLLRPTAALRPAALDVYMVMEVAAHIPTPHSEAVSPRPRPHALSRCAQSPALGHA